MKVHENRDLHLHAGVVGWMVSVGLGAVLLQACDVHHNFVLLYMWFYIHLVFLKPVPIPFVHRAPNSSLRIHQAQL